MKAIAGPRGLHDVYDGTSRSKPFPISSNQSLHPSQSQDTALVRIKRNDIAVPHSNPSKRNRVFVLENFLTFEECQELIEQCDNIGFTDSDVATEYPEEYRNNQRIIVIQDELADTLWFRLKFFLQQNDITGITPYGFKTEGVWIPTRLNNCFLFSKYCPQQYFKMHYDGLYKNSLQEVSIFTLTLYLNDNFKGGELYFRQSKEEPSILATYKPKLGDAVLFNHDILHEGNIVTEGCKYIARTSVMFRKSSDLSDSKELFKMNPQYQWMRNIFRNFDALAAQNDALQFTSSFLAVQQIQLFHHPCVQEEHQQWLPFELCVELLHFLANDLSSIFNFSLLCKHCYWATNSSIVWKNIYTSHFGVTATKIIEKQERVVVESLQKTALLDWFTKFVLRYSLEKSKPNCYIYLTNTVHTRFKKQQDSSESFLALAYRDSDPWDYSFGNWIIGDEEYGNSWFYHYEVDWYEEVLPQLIDHAVSSITEEQKTNPKKSVILVSFPRYWMKNFVLQKQSETDWMMEHQVETYDEKTQKELEEENNWISNRNISYFEEYISNMYAQLNIVDAGLCTLFGYGKTSGLVLYRYKLLEVGKIIMEFRLFENSKCVTIYPWIKVSETEHVTDQMKVVLKQLNEIALQMKEANLEMSLCVLSDETKLTDYEANFRVFGTALEPHVSENGLQYLNPISSVPLNQQVKNTLDGAEFYASQHLLMESTVVFAAK